MSDWQLWQLKSFSKSSNRCYQSWNRPKPVLPLLLSHTAVSMCSDYARMRPSQKGKATLLTNSSLMYLLRLAENDGFGISHANNNKNNVRWERIPATFIQMLVYLKIFLLSPLAISMTPNHHYCYNEKYFLCQITMTNQFTETLLRSLLSEKWFVSLAEVVISWTSASADPIIKTFKWLVLNLSS